MFLFPLCFHHDAFMHHAIHVLDAPDNNDDLFNGVVTQARRYEGELQLTKSGICNAEQIGLETDF